MNPYDLLQRHPLPEVLRTLEWETQAHQKPPTRAESSSAPTVPAPPDEGEES